jgi:hypothetical protein
MAEIEFLTPPEVAKRYRNEITVGTLRNWRALRIGPQYLKIGKKILYPLRALEAWDRENLVTCPSEKTTNGTVRDQT